MVRVLLIAATTLGLIWLPAQVIIELETMLVIITMFPLAFSLLILRWRYPGVRRPFEVPGGHYTAGLVFWVGSPVVCCLAVGVILWLADDPAFHYIPGVPHLSFIFAAAVIAVGLVGHAVYLATGGSKRWPASEAQGSILAIRRKTTVKHYARRRIDTRGDSGGSELMKSDLFDDTMAGPAEPGTYGSLTSK